MSKEVKRVSKRTLDPLGLFDKGGNDNPVDAPAATPGATGPTAMPDPEGDAVAAAKRRKLVEMKKRGGRASTIVSEDFLGG